MAVYTLKTEQKLPISLQAAWDFFSNPANLKKITPSYLYFKIHDGFGDEKMYPGQIIQYTVKPMLGIPVTWVTEITQVKELDYFVDEQRYGPYAMWHHKHFFKEIENGVHMTDLVHYKIPFGMLGRLMHPLIVKRKLKEIFDFRSTTLEKHFGQYKAK